MLEKFDFIANVGRFERVQNSPELDQLTLVYSENGRGKTTLCSILRSLTTCDPRFIHERRRLSANSDCRVVAQLDGNQSVFANGSWSHAAGPKFLIFDERFVNENVYSGLSVEPGHRKKVHELVIGEQGVAYQHKVKELTERIATLQTVVKQKQEAFTADILGGMKIDDFCALPPLDGLDEAIEEAKRTVSVIESATVVASTGIFEPFAIPTIDAKKIATLLAASLAQVQRDSLEAVKSHVAKLGAGSEQWISHGIQLAKGNSNCPFCDQGLSKSSLFGHYESYFSAAYAEHIRAISSERQSIATTLSGDALAHFQRKLHAAKGRIDFWKSYVRLPELGVDAETVATAWSNLRTRLLAELDAKASNPLEAMSLHQDTENTLNEYNILSVSIEQLGNILYEKNVDVRQVKEQAKHGSLSTSQGHLLRLSATKKRYEPEVKRLCDEYRLAKKDKEQVEAEKRQARTDLDNHRTSTFPKHEVAINKFLLRFNADFTVNGLQPTDPRGEPSSNYALGVNRHSVSLTPNPNVPEPSFGTTLSAGDRNTLALAFFFASLNEDPSLQDAVVVIDDPASSLDDGRTVATAQEIRGLCGKAKQVIVLSHTKGLLCEIWQHADQNGTASLEIVDQPQEASAITTWNVHEAAITEYDRRHKILRAFVNDTEGEPPQVAVALRPVLEGFLRTACVEHFPPGTMLGPFINHAMQLAANGNPLMSSDDLEELDKLRQYANRFHHENPAWQQELANISQKELKGYARRTLEFTNAMRRI